MFLFFWFHFSLVTRLLLLTSLIHNDLYCLQNPSCAAFFLLGLLLRSFYSKHKLTQVTALYSINTGQMFCSYLLSMLLKEHQIISISKEFRCLFRWPTDDDHLKMRKPFNHEHFLFLKYLLPLKYLQVIQNFLILNYLSSRMAVVIIKVY